MRRDPQPTLWDPPRPVRRRRRHTADTSTDGLLAIQPHAHTQQRLVLDTLRAWGPSTRHELAAMTGLPLSSICGRVAELVAEGSVRERVVCGRRIRRDGRHVVEAVFNTQQRRAG